MIRTAPVVLVVCTGGTAVATMPGNQPGRGPMITEFNRAAMETPADEKRLEVVPGAARLLNGARPW